MVLLLCVSKESASLPSSALMFRFAIFSFVVSGKYRFIAPFVQRDVGYRAGMKKPTPVTGLGFFIDFNRIRNSLFASQFFFNSGRFSLAALQVVQLSSAYFTSFHKLNFINAWA